MKDYLGKELNVGDTVIFCRPSYRDLTTGVIKKITKCFVFMDYKDYYGREVVVKQEGKQVIKYFHPDTNLV